MKHSQLKQLIKEEIRSTLNEDKGGELANKVIMNFRKLLRDFNDDEVYSFRKKIAMAIDAELR